MALIGYARVSTEDQNPDLQLDALRAVGCTDLHVDRASGARRDRVALAAAMSQLERGDVLVVWRLDRLARSLLHLIELVAMLDAKGAGFRSLTEAIDTTSAGGRLVFQIFGALAEFERALIGERTKAGLTAARSRGRIGGRRPKINGEETALARALIADGMSVAAAAGDIGVSRATLYRHLAHATGDLR